MLLEDPARLAGKRTTLADYFAQLADSSAPYLQYDNGYRSWSYTYAQVGSAARTFSAKLDAEGITQRVQKKVGACAILIGDEVRSPSWEKQPAVPVRLRGVEKILHRGQLFPRPGPVEVAFGPPLHLSGEDYPDLARQVEQAIREL